MNGSFGRWARIGLFAVALLGTAPVARSQEPRIIPIAAQRFAFSPNELRLHKGKPVTLRISSADVTHGMYMKALGIDTEIEPGKTSDVTLTPQATGRFTAICHHFCGAGHGNMHLVIVVE